MIFLSRHIRRVILELAFWLLLEFLGNASGLDALADFGEFVFSKETHFPVPELALILTEMINWKLWVFIPVNEQAVAVIEKIRKLA